MKEIIIITIIAILVWVGWAWAVSSLISDTSKEIHKQGGIGTIMGKTVHDFNKAVEGK